jgi:hypothetical protein
MVASSSYGSVTFSPAIQQDLTLFSDIDGTKKAFLGDLAHTDYGQQGLDWKNDQLDVSSKNAAVRVYYLDELTENTGKGWFSKLFG